MTDLVLSAAPRRLRDNYKPLQPVLVSGVSMEPKYQQAIRTGLACGIVIAVIYLGLGVIDQYLNSTPAMVSYYDKALQPFQQMMKDWPDVSGHEYTTPPDLPGPPGEYYAAMGLQLLSTVVLVVGLLLAGAYAIIKGAQRLYPTQEAAYLGALSGLAALVPVVVAGLILCGIMIVFQGPLHIMINDMPGSMSATLPAMAVASCCCCGLPVVIVMAVILAVIGALACAFLTKRLGEPELQA